MAHQWVLRIVGALALADVPRDQSPQDDTKLAPQNCFLSADIHAHNILVVMANILLRYRFCRALGLDLVNRIDAPARIWPTSHQLAA
jgi:hypothetical protein